VQGTDEQYVEARRWHSFRPVKPGSSISYQSFQFKNLRPLRSWPLQVWSLLQEKPRLDNRLHTTEKYFSDVNRFQDRAQQPKRKKKPISQKMQLALAPRFIPEGSYSEVNYFHNDSPRPYQGNDIFNNVVSIHGRGDGKKEQKARAVDYSGGNGNDMYYEHLGRNDAFKNVNNRGRRENNNNFIPDIPMNNGLHMGNVGNFNGQMRHDRSGNIGQGSIITQPEPHHGGRRRGRRN
jgi:hypothetical protein